MKTEELESDRRWHGNSVSRGQGDLREWGKLNRYCGKKAICVRATNISKGTLDWMKEDENNWRQKSEGGQYEKCENC